MGENIVLALFLLSPCASAGVLLLLLRRIRRRRSGQRWIEILFGNVLILIFLVGTLFSLGEIYYRFIYDTTEGLAYTKTSVIWGERYWHLNSDNIRDNIEYPSELKPARRRITFVGDSFAAGHGIKDVEHRFVNLIRRAHPEWEVHALAVPGFDTWEEKDILSFFLKYKYQIDQVVLVYCLNDVSDLLPGRAENIGRINIERSGRGWLQRNSYFVDTIYHRLKVHRDPFMKNYYNFVLEGYRGPIWEQEKQRLKEFREMVESHGGRFSVVTFPFLHALGSNYEYQIAHQELDALWREWGVPHLDLLPVYSNLPPRKITVNKFDAHPNELAHKLAAAAIDRFLMDQLTEKR